MIGKGHPLPNRTRERIRKLHSEGLQVQAIAESCGVSRRSVYRAIQLPKPAKADLTEAQTKE
jgi:transposase